jgi:glucose/arabinose dehydrogenase
MATRRFRSLLTVSMCLAIAAATIGDDLTPRAAGSRSVLAFPAGFSSQVVFSGLTNPVDIAFAPNGRVFVAESAGKIKSYDSVSDTTATVFADLRREVYSADGQGLLGIAVDPDFPSRPYVYAVYSRDSRTKGGSVPYWRDACPSAQRLDGCLSYSRLVRITSGGATATGTPKVLLDQWCTQFLNHTVGAVRFGPDGYLYVSAGDGADYRATPDYGQHGNPTTNPCNDPPGGTLTPPTTQGGALRAQDVRTSTDPASLDGAVIRIHPDTGVAVATNPFASSGDLAKRRVLAYGLRNPFRMAFQPGSRALWILDNGWNTADEVNVVGNVSGGNAPNFGWPCYEGRARQPLWRDLPVDLCRSLYTAGDARLPSFRYLHGAPVFGSDSCHNSGGAPSAIAFYNNTRYPARYQGALFFGDWMRECIYVVPRGAGGQPDFAVGSRFANISPRKITDLETGPRGDLFFVDNQGGAVLRIRYQDPSPS